MTDDQFATYLAGFTDGEGWIGYQKDRNGKKCAIGIAIANTHKESLEFIQTKLGFGYIDSQKFKEHWKRRYCLKIRNMSDCLKFLEIIKPFSIIKANIINEAINFIKQRMVYWQGIAERNNKIVNLAKDGWLRKDIAKHFGVSPQLVSSKCEGHKWPSEMSKFAKKRKRDSRGLFMPIHNAP